jgi:hypothetical protein
MNTCQNLNIFLICAFLQTFPKGPIHDDFIDPDLLEDGVTRQTVRIRAALNELRNEQRREEPVVAESPQEQPVDEGYSC